MISVYLQPLYGHHTPDAPHFSPVNEVLYSIHDPEVKLEDIAIATPITEHTLPDPPSVKGRERERKIYFMCDVIIMLLTVLATWLSVEGVAIGNTESSDTSSQDQVIVNRTSNEVNLYSLY